MEAIPLPLSLHEHDNRMYPMANHFILFFHTLDGSLSWSRQSKLLATWTLSDLIAPALLFTALAINPNVGTSCTRLHAFPACSLQTFRPLPLLLIDDFYLQNENVIGIDGFPYFFFFVVFLYYPYILYTTISNYLIIRAPIC